MSSSWSLRIKTPKRKPYTLLVKTNLVCSVKAKKKAKVEKKSKKVKPSKKWTMITKQSSSRVSVLTTMAP